MLCIIKLHNHEVYDRSGSFLWVEEHHWRNQKSIIFSIENFYIFIIFMAIICLSFSRLGGVLEVDKIAKIWYSLTLFLSKNRNLLFLYFAQSKQKEGWDAKHSNPCGKPRFRHGAWIEANRTL